MVKIIIQNYKMNFQHNAYEIRNLFDIMKDVVTDVCIVFSKTDISIRTVDPENIVVVNMIIQNPDKYSFEFDDPVYIGVNMQNLYKLIRGATSVHQIQFEIHKDTQNVLKIIISHPSTGIVSTTSLYSLDMKKSQPILSPYTYDAVCRLPTAQMLRAIKDLSHGSKKITISSSKEDSAANLWFSSSGMSYVYTTSIAISPSQDGLMWIYKNKDKLNGQYITKYIERFCKPTVGKLIELSFKEDGLLTLSYPLMKLGELSMTVAPIIDQINEE